jgi:hypothetical protein
LGTVPIARIVCRGFQVLERHVDYVEIAHSLCDYFLITLRREAGLQQKRPQTKTTIFIAILVCGP